jgi:hypothetical protein
MNLAFTNLLNSYCLQATASMCMTLSILLPMKQWSVPGKPLRSAVLLFRVAAQDRADRDAVCVACRLAPPTCL